MFYFVNILDKPPLSRYNISKALNSAPIPTAKEKTMRYITVDLMEFTYPDMFTYKTMSDVIVGEAPRGGVPIQKYSLFLQRLFIKRLFPP